MGFYRKIRGLSSSTANSSLEDQCCTEGYAIYQNHEKALRQYIEYGLKIEMQSRLGIPFIHDETGGEKDTMNNEVYVCYEENRHDLAIENGAVNALCLKSRIEDAVDWLKKRIELGNKSGFFVDKEVESVDDEIKKELARGEFSIVITMFAGHQENWDESYDIIVWKKDVD